MKKVLAATLLIASLTTTTAFAKEDDHEKEFKHHKHHEVKKVKTPASTPSPTPTTPTQTPTIPTTTITNPLGGFAVTLGIPAGFDTSVKRVSIMWAKGVAYSYNVYVDGIKQMTVLDSQGLTFMEFQQNMTLGIHTVGISVVDQNGNESQQCIKSVTVQ